jgi:hypothetical protein
MLLSENVLKDKYNLEQEVISGTYHNKAKLTYQQSKHIKE